MPNKFVYSLIVLLESVLAFNHPTDKLLSEFFRANRKLTSSERTLVTTTIYTILRNYHKLTTTLAIPMQSRHAIAQLIGLCWLKILNYPAAELTRIKLLDPNHVQNLILATDKRSTLEFPDWLVASLQEQYNDADISSLASSMQQLAPLDLRVNLLKNNLKTAQAILQDSGVLAVPSEFSPLCLRIKDKSRINRHPLFTSGGIEIQSESSQLAGMLLAPRRGEMVVDFCAGSGGKSLLFGMLMHNTGRVYAFDVHDKRLNNLYPRLARSGLSNIHPELITGTNDSKLKRLHNKIDRVFVDAPCSGLGTLRRNPELKFRHNPSTIAELSAKQLDILTAASKLVKVGGHLVYATCSILFAENQAIAQLFLAENPNFILKPASSILNHPQLERPDGYLVLLPHIHGTDGFFASLFTRMR